MARAALNFWQATGFGTGQWSKPHGWIDYFTGAYLPRNIVLGGAAGFLWPHSDTPATFATTFSGTAFDSNRHYATIQENWRGYFWPVIRESGFLGGNNFGSGAVIRDNLDNVGLPIVASGRFAGDNIDSGVKMGNTFSSGVWSRVDSDNGFASVRITGIANSVRLITGSLGISFHAGFTKPDSTGMGIGMILTQAIYSDTQSFQEKDFYGTSVVTFALTQVIYQNAA